MDFVFVSFLFVSQFTSSFMCVCLRIVVSNTYCVVFLFLFVMCFVYPMLPVSLDYPLFLAPAVFSDVYLTVLWIFHPSQTGSTLQFEKHASQKQIVSFTTIPPTLNIITACTCKVPITCLRASPARSFWTFGHCDFVTKTYFKVQFSCVLPNWKRTSVCELRYVVVNYVTVGNSTCTTCKHNDIGR